MLAKSKTWGNMDSDYLKKFMNLLSRFIFILFFLSGCEKERDLENYGDLSTTPGGIVIIDPEEHVGGYGREECLVCHQTALNLHRSKGSLIGDVDELNQLIRQNGESKFCLTCHGSNGTDN